MGNFWRNFPKNKGFSTFCQYSFQVFFSKRQKLKKKKSLVHLLISSFSLQFDDRYLSKWLLTIVQLYYRVSHWKSDVLWSTQLLFQWVLGFLPIEYFSVSSPVRRGTSNKNNFLLVNFPDELLLNFFGKLFGGGLFLMNFLGELFGWTPCNSWIYRSICDVKVLENFMDLPISQE